MSTVCFTRGRYYKYLDSKPKFPGSQVVLTRVIYPQETLLVITLVAVVVVGAVANGISWMNAGEAAKHPTTHDTKNVSVQNVHSAKVKNGAPPPSSTRIIECHPDTSLKHRCLFYRKENRHRKQTI